MNLYTFSYIYENNIYKKLVKKTYSLEDINMLQVNFIMIYIIHKISVLLKITQITLKKVFLNAFSRSIVKKKLITFFTTYNDEKFKT